MRQCVAVRAAVCGSARQCVSSVCGSVLAAVYGSAHGDVYAVIYEPNIPRILLIVTDISTSY